MQPASAVQLSGALYENHIDKPPAIKPGGLFLKDIAMRTERRKNAGFTLIELSIVLVIIGLIIGGVLVGQDMINAAQLRQIVSQVGQYHSAVNTFRNKYGSIPGDITGTATGQASSFGLFFETTLGGAAGHGDGNGLVESDTGGIGTTKAIGETLSFWRHLTEANLIGGSFGLTGPSAISATTGQANANVTNMLQSVPETKLGRGTNYIVYAVNGLNYYQLISTASITAATGAYTFGASAMTPVEAATVDGKMDDGAPNSGVVRARGIAAVNVSPSWPVGGASTNDFCVMGGASATDTAGTYNRVLNTGGNNPSCSLRFQFN
jgi:prepilin-type N-terminal cleavage/methylation domain-containing protein